MAVIKNPRNGIFKTLMLLVLILGSSLLDKSLMAEAKKSSLNAKSKPTSKTKNRKGEHKEQAQSASNGPLSPEGPNGRSGQSSNFKKPKTPKFDIAYKLNGFGGKYEKKMREALGRLAWVVRSEEFKQKVLNHTYKGKKAYYQNRGLNNEQIYQAILKGAEDLNPIENQRMDLKLTLYYSQTNTVGYTYPNTNEIWVNRKYFEKYTLAEVANNAMHEWLHKIGFEHSYYHNSDRPYTVPYAIGEIVEEIINGLN